MKLDNRTRLFLADTVAMVVFSFATGMVIELLIAGLTLVQSLTSRVVAIPMNLITARPYGLYRDAIMKRIRIENKRLRSAVDILVFTSFQIPVYIFVLLVSGANFDFCRRIFKVEL